MSLFLYYLSDVLIFTVPLLALFGLYLTGYHLAQSDFRPKPFSRREPDETEATAVSAKKRELTLNELGIRDIKDPLPSPPGEQRKNRMRETLLKNASESPDRAAGIVKSWLRD